ALPPAAGIAGGVAGTARTSARSGLAPDRAAAPGGAAAPTAQQRGTAAAAPARGWRPPPPGPVQTLAGLPSADRDGPGAGAQVSEATGVQAGGRLNGERLPELPRGRVISL